MVEEFLNLSSHAPARNAALPNSVCQDARLILKKCQELQSSLQQPPSCPELGAYANSLHNMLVESYSKEIVQGLSRDTRLVLSLIYWHFGALGLRKSLRSPLNESIAKDIYAHYQACTHQDVSYEDFVISLNFLLSLPWP
jgi:hypothetical protein